MVSDGWIYVLTEDRVVKRLRADVGDRRVQIVLERDDRVSPFAKFDVSGSLLAFYYHNEVLVYRLDRTGRASFSYRWDVPDVLKVLIVGEQLCVGTRDGGIDVVVEGDERGPRLAGHVPIVPGIGMGRVGSKVAASYGTSGGLVFDPVGRDPVASALTLPATSSCPPSHRFAGSASDVIAVGSTCVTRYDLQTRPVVHATGYGVEIHSQPLYSGGWAVLWKTTAGAQLVDLRGGRPVVGAAFGGGPPVRKYAFEQGELFAASHEGLLRMPAGGLPIVWPLHEQKISARSLDAVEVSGSQLVIAGVDTLYSRALSADGSTRYRHRIPIGNLRSICRIGSQWFASSVFTGLYEIRIDIVGVMHTESVPGSNAAYVNAVGDVLLIRDRPGNLSVFDPDEGTVVARFPEPLIYANTQIDSDGSIAVVGDSHGLWVVDLSVPSAPRVGPVHSRGYGAGRGTVAIEGDLVVDSAQGVRILRIEPDLSLTPVSEVREATGVDRMELRDAVLAVSSPTRGLALYDLGNPALPVLRGRIADAALASSVAFAGDVILVGKRDGVLSSYPMPKRN